RLDLRRRRSGRPGSSRREPTAGSALAEEISCARAIAGASGGFMRRGLVAVHPEGAQRTRRTISRKTVLLSQTIAFAILLAVTLAGALIFAGAENERGVLGMLKGGVADELADRVLRADPRPMGRPISLYAVVDADGD